MKIIGITVGTTTPKPNFDQTDPSKGDYIYGDRSFLNSIKTINDISPDENGNIVMEPDATLTQYGMAADAKVVGDAFSELVGDVPVATQISDAINNNIKQSDWNQTNDGAADFIKNRPEATTVEDIQSLFLQ